MTNNIKKVIEDSFGEFEEKFPVAEFYNIFQEKNYRIFRDEVYPDDIKSHLSTTISNILSAIEAEVTESIGYGKFGFSNEKGEVCIKLSDIQALLKSANPIEGK